MRDGHGRIASGQAQVRTGLNNLPEQQRVVCNNFFINIMDERRSFCSPAACKPEDCALYNAGGESRNGMKRPGTSLRERPGRAENGLRHSIGLRKKLVRQQDSVAAGSRNGQAAYKSCVAVDAADDSQFYRFMEEELGVKQLDSESVLGFISADEDSETEGNEGNVLEQRQFLDLKNLDLDLAEEAKAQVQTQEGEHKAFRIKTKVSRSVRKGEDPKRTGDVEKTVND